MDSYPDTERAVSFVRILPQMGQVWGADVSADPLCTTEQIRFLFSLHLRIRQKTRLLPSHQLPCQVGTPHQDLPAGFLAVAVPDSFYRLVQCFSFHYFPDVISQLTDAKKPITWSRLFTGS